MRSTIYYCKHGVLFSFSTYQIKNHIKVKYKSKKQCTRRTPPTPFNTIRPFTVQHLTSIDSLKRSNLTMLISYVIDLPIVVNTTMICLVTSLHKPGFNSLLQLGWQDNSQVCPISLQVSPT